MIEIRSAIKFGGSAAFPTGRAKGGKLGGQGSSSQAVRQVVRWVNKPFVSGVQSGKLRDVILESAREKVMKRTSEGGRDSDAKTFRPYTPRYRALKAMRGQWSGKVDLKATGAMLEAIEGVGAYDPLKGFLRVKPLAIQKVRGRGKRKTRGGKTISLKDLARIHHRGEGKQPKRPFFALRAGSKEYQNLMNEARQFMRDEMRKHMKKIR